MSTFIQNYGFTKTLIQDNFNNQKLNQIQWNGNYDGNVANINIGINDNGNKEYINMKLNNNDLRDIFGIQQVDIPLEKRLMNDFLSKNPISLEGALIKRKRRTHRKKNNKKRTKKLY